MKINRISYFIMGLVGIAVFLLHVLSDSPTSDLLRYILILAVSLYCLYLGLSKKGAEQYRTRSRRYNAAGELLYGKYYHVKANLPLVLTGVFFAVALVLRFLFQTYTSPIIAVIFVLILTGTVFYTIGMNRSIREYLDAHPEFDAEDPSSLLPL